MPLLLSGGEADSDSTLRRRLRHCAAPDLLDLLLIDEVGWSASPVAETGLTRHRSSGMPEPSASHFSGWPPLA